MEAASIRNGRDFTKFINKYGKETEMQLVQPISNHADAGDLGD
ncbi:hypothetical protein [Rhodoflexus caldus]|nr:hypothetical protein [Rhodoflexus caldus]